MTVDLDQLPERVVVGKNGAYWRDYGDGYSMCPVSTDNDPVEPVAVYVRAAEASDVRVALHDAAREVVRFYGTDRTWSLVYRTLLGSRIDDLAAALAAADRAERGLPLAGDDRRPDVAPGDDLRTAHADSTRLPLSLSASGEASVPAIVAADAGEPLRVWAGMDAEWKRLRRIEAAARDLDNLAPIWPESAHSDWSPDGIAAIGELRAALAADPQSPTGEG